jgi:hypothetical protein
MPVAKKSVVKKPALKNELVFEADVKKETPGTFHFAENAEREDQISGGIYVKKSALDGVSPTKVRVTIEILAAE